METLFSFIQDYGYFFVFIATILEGETILALASFASYQGYLYLPTVMLIGFVGAVIGDNLFFYFGRYKGKKFLENHPKFNEKAFRIHALIERHQDLLIFGSRFMYGFRTVIPIAIGTSKVSGLRFLALNILGAIVWAIFFGSIGYAFGSVLESVLGGIHRAQKYIILGVIAGVILVHIIRLIYGIVVKKLEIEEKKEENKDKNALGMDNSSRAQKVD